MTIRATNNVDAAATNSNESPALRSMLWLRRQLVESGVTDNQIRRLVKAGYYSRVRHGAYALSADWNPLTPEQRHQVRARAILMTAHESTVLSHTSAVIEHGGSLWGVPLDVVHTTRNDKTRAGRKADDWRQHRGHLPDDDTVEVNGVRVTKPARAALEMCMIAGVEHSLVAVNGLFRAKQMTIDDFRAEVQAHEAWPHTLRANVVLRLADDRTESVGEDRFLYLAFRQGLPRPESQFECFDADGTLLGRVDFAWPEKRVFLEFDGDIKYKLYRREGESLDDFIMREKKRQEKICLLTGWTCIRVTWADLAQPVLLANRIRNVFASQRASA